MRGLYAAADIRETGGGCVKRRHDAGKREYVQGRRDAGKQEYVQGRRDAGKQESMCRDGAVPEREVWDKGSAENAQV